MTAKQRIQRLEKTAPKPNDKQFRQEVRASGNTYFIDGVQVDAAKYHTEHADYVTSRGIERTVNMDVIWCGGGCSTSDGTYEFRLLFDELMSKAEKAARIEGLLADNETFDNCHNDAVRDEIRRRVLAELELQKGGVA
jgi:hypothetical protein